MSRFIDLSSADKKDFSMWLLRHLERGFLHRLNANEQRALLCNFAVGMALLVRHPDFAPAQSLADTLEPRQYSENEALGKLTECLELCIDDVQTCTPRKSVYDRLVFIERYVALFYQTVLFKE